MIDNDTRSLLERWHAGSPEAQRALAEKNLDWVENRVRERLGTHLLRVGELRDFAHEALLDFLQYAPRFQVASGAQLRALLARVVENAIRDQDDFWFRAQRRAISQEMTLGSDSVVDLGARVRPATPPEEGAARNEMSALLRLAVELLDPADRKVVLLRHWDDLEFPVIAERLGVGEEAARKRYQRALPRVARLVERLQRGELGEESSGPG